MSPYVVMKILSVRTERLIIFRPTYKIEDLFTLIESVSF